jgi:adenylate cyclase
LALRPVAFIGKIRSPVRGILFGGSKILMDKVAYPIGAKLIIIISAISLVSLGAITALSTYFITNDVRITAEDNNYSINRLAAFRTEESLSELRTGADVLLNIIASTGQEAELARQAAAWFFDGRRDIAAIAAFKGHELSVLLVNQRFFDENEIETALAGQWLDGEERYITRAVLGETVIRNAAPGLGAPVLALIYPRPEGAAAALFSSSALTENFGIGANLTYIINDEADVLVHPNNDLAGEGVNLGNRNFIREVRQNTQASMQSLFTDEEGNRFFGAFTKLAIGNGTVITEVEYNYVFEGIAATTRRNIYLSAAVLFIAGILIWFFSRTISVPIKILTMAAEQIEGGDFEVNLQPRTKDEIGALTGSFGRMSKALLIFGRFTNRETALRAMRGEIKPGGLPKYATIFFSDIRGFTEKSENFTREYGEGASDKIVQWLNDYFSRMVDCVEKTGGVVDKFIGDAVMAHWGAASTAGSPEKDAFNCVMAALAMRSVLLDMNKNRRAGDPGNPPIRIGCGINTGMVTAGQIGSEKRMEYTVVGDPVNLASRTETLNKPFATDILITENTFALIGKYFITSEMPTVKLKGKNEKIKIFAVIGPRGKNGETVRGPQTLDELRKLLGIAPPRPDRVDAGTEETKYKIEPESAR